MNIFDEFKECGFVFQIIDEDVLCKVFEEGFVFYYIGYDFMVDSFYFGYLVVILIFCCL